MDLIRLEDKPDFMVVTSDGVINLKRGTRGPHEGYKEFRNVDGDIVFDGK